MSSHHFLSFILCPHLLLRFSINSVFTVEQLSRSLDSDTTSTTLQMLSFLSEPDQSFSQTCTDISRFSIKKHCKHRHALIPINVDMHLCKTCILEFNFLFGCHFYEKCFFFLITSSFSLFTLLQLLPTSLG